MSSPSDSSRPSPAPSSEETSGRHAEPPAPVSIFAVSPSGDFKETAANAPNDDGTTSDDLSDSLFGLLLPADGEEEEKVQDEAILRQPSQHVQPPLLPGHLKGAAVADHLSIPPRRGEAPFGQDENRAREPSARSGNATFSKETVFWIIAGILSLAMTLFLSALLLVAAEPTAFTEYPIPLLGHPGKTLLLDYGANGSVLATVSSDRSIIVRDGVTGTPKKHIDGREAPKQTPTALALNPDASTLFLASRDNMVGMWDLATGRRTRAVPIPGDAEVMRATADGKFLVAGLENGDCCVWSQRLDAPPQFLKGHTKRITCLAVRPGPCPLAVGSDDRTVSIWALKAPTPAAPTEKPPAKATGNRRPGRPPAPPKPALPRVVFRGHKDAVTAVAFQPTMNRVASAGKNKSIILWEFDPDTASTKEIRTLHGHAGEITFLAFSRDGSSLLSGSLDKTLIQWDVGTGERLARFENTTTFPITAGVARPDFSTVALLGKDGAAALHDATSLDLRIAAPPAPLVPPSAFGALPHLVAQSFHPDSRARANSLCFLPDPRHGLPPLFCGGTDQSGLYDANAAQPFYLLPDGTDIRCAIFSRDGSTLITGARDGSFTTRRANDGKTIQRFRGHADAVLDLAISRDAARLFSASADRNLVAWGTNTGNALAVLRGHTDAVVSVDVNPDTRTLLSASEDRRLGLWTTGGTLIRMIDAHEEALTAARFDGTGDRIASASLDKTVRIWETGTLLKKDGTAPADATPLKIIRGFNDATLCLRFSPDDTMLAVGGKEGRIVLFDTRTWAPIFTVEQIPPPKNTAPAPGSAPPPSRKTSPTLPVPPEPVLALEFCSDGTSLASSGDKSLYVWDLRASFATLREGNTHGDPTDSATAPGSPAGSDPYARLPLGKQVAVRSVSDPLLSAPRLSPDGRGAVAIVARDTGNEVACFSFDPESETLPPPLCWKPPGTPAVADFQTAQTAVVGTETGHVCLWDIKADRSTALTKLHAGAIRDVDVDRAGKTILTGDANGSLVLWNERGAFLGRLTGHTGPVTAVALTPDGTRALSAAEDGLVIAWDTTTKNELLRFREHGRKGATALAVFADGNRCASVDRNGRIVLYTLHPVPSVTRKVETGLPLLAVAPSPDGACLATAGGYGRVLFWNTGDGKPLSALPLQQPLLNRLEFSLDGATLLTAGEKEFRMFRIVKP